jgi:hypothetical protein
MENGQRKSGGMAGNARPAQQNQHVADGQFFAIGNDDRVQQRAPKPARSPITVIAYEHGAQEIWTHDRDFASILVRSGVRR